MGTKAIAYSTHSYSIHSIFPMKNSPRKITRKLQETIRKLMREINLLMSFRLIT